MLERIKKELKKAGFLKKARTKDVMARALRFAQQNKDIIILVLDPKTDDIVAAYNKHYSMVNIRSKILKLKVHVVRDILEGKDVDFNINKVLQVMDAFLFHLAKMLNPKRSADKKPNKQ